MKNPFTRALFCALALTLTLFSAPKAAAVVVAQTNVLTLNITFYTQKIDTNTTHSVLDYKIVKTTLDTADMLKIMAEDLGVTNGGHVGFPKGSYFVLSEGINVRSLTGQTWDVSNYLQYSLAANVGLGHGTTPLIQGAPNNLQDVLSDPTGIIYTDLVHIHFEDANHLADFTGFATTRDGTLMVDGKTTMSPAPGSGTLDGMPALIAGAADLTSTPPTIK